MDRELCRKVAAYVVSRDNGELKSLKVSNVARFFGMPPSRLSRLFKRSMSIDLAAFIRSHKMARAFHIFIGGGLQGAAGSISIEQMAKETGFRNADCFLELFIQHYGISPEDLRKERDDRFPPHEFN